MTRTSARAGDPRKRLEGGWGGIEGARQSELSLEIKFFLIQPIQTQFLAQELVSQEKAQSSGNAHDEVDLDELMDDPELERLHADRIASLRKEAEKGQEMKQKGHGGYFGSKR